ncbi:MAG: SPOR domain-containing protein [Chitinispirillaceae bacterium]|nr:SPOR domain-containing protein [Chitinispirillaceae bacterium]
MSGLLKTLAVAEVLLGVVLAGTSGAVADADHIAGVKLLEKGSYMEAAKRLGQAYRSHPSDCRIASDYARVAPCSLSVAIYTRCATDTTVPDSLRAASYGQLGDYSFVHSAFKTAAEKYRLASTIRSDPYYRHRWALAAAALHDIKTARSLWHTITLDHGTLLALEAHYRIGLIDMEEGLYDSAFQRFCRAGGIDAARSWTIAATAAKLECAIKLGKADSVKALEKRLQPFGEQLLERDLLDLASLRTEKKTAGAPADAPVPSGDETAYTLQVGAFGSLDNATNLQKRLEQRFREVSILPVTLSDKVFYRVRIGAFKSKAAAEAYGGDSLAPAGITFKAVPR